MSSYPPGPQTATQPAVPRPRFPTSYRAALRVATAIAVVKWVLIALLVLGAIPGSVYLFTTSDGSDFAGGPLVIIWALGLLALLLVVLLVWVVLGWFEHTLRVLVAVADHTRGA